VPGATAPINIARTNDSHGMTLLLKTDVISSPTLPNVVALRAFEKRENCGD
jgi:hypothetical protein